MSTAFFILGGLFALATLATLMTGVVGMGKGGGFNDKYGNKLMRMRVILQGCAVGCFVIGLLTR
jgi:VIT1/CCC1 family predicted Fe2+/Mn2+ transporter